METFFWRLPTLGQSGGPQTFDRVLQVRGAGPVVAGWRAGMSAIKAMAYAIGSDRLARFERRPGGGVVADVQSGSCLPPDVAVWPRIA